MSSTKYFRPSLSEGERGVEAADLGLTGSPRLVIPARLRQSRVSSTARSGASRCTLVGRVEGVRDAVGTRENPRGRSDVVVDLKSVHVRGVVDTRENPNGKF